MYGKLSVKSLKKDRMGLDNVSFKARLQAV